MKTLQLYMYGILFCVLSMGMGFPDIIMEKDMPRVAKRKEVKNVAKKAANTHAPKVVTCTQINKASNTKRPQRKTSEVTCFPNQAVASLKDIYLKLFDKKGNLLLIENIKIEEFLSKNYPKLNLPAGSTFVMFHGNTAYYYLETSI